MEEIVTFLNDLAQNNNREWFNEHKKRYKKVQAHFLDVVQALIFGINQFDDLGPLAAKECTFRIYRDMRFSKDKKPYKENMGGYIARGGRKSGQAGYYLHIQPGESFLAGGQYAPSKEQLQAIRQSIIEDAAPLREVIAAEAFKSYFGELGGDKLKTAPRGIKRDHPEIDLLRHKQFVVMHRLSDEQVLAADFQPYALEVFRAMRPLVACLNEMQKMPF